MKQDKKYQILLVFLLINLASTLILSGVFIVHSNTSKEAGSNHLTSDVIDYTSSANKKYTLYIGTNDKDTYQQMIPTEEARDIVNKICVKYVDGYTSSDACGGWVDETDTLTQENTLVYYFYGVMEQQMVSIMKDVLKELNQNSILVEVQDINYAYYYGDDVRSGE